MGVEWGELNEMDRWMDGWIEGGRAKVEGQGARAEGRGRESKC